MVTRPMPIDRPTSRGAHGAILGRAMGMLAALIAILACLPAGASAHLEFASSSPTGGSVADSPIERVTLTFTKEGRLVAPGIRLLDSGGTPIAAEVTPASTGTSFTVTPASPLGPGRYGVAWRIAAPDAHPKAGSFTFEVRSTAGADAAPTPAAPASTDDGDRLDQALAAPSTDGPRALRSGARVLMYAGTLLALGALLFIAFATSAAPAVLSWQFGAVRAGGALLMAGALAGYAGRAWLLGARSDDVAGALRDALSGASGAGLLLALAGGALIAFGTRIARRPDPARPGRVRGSLRRSVPGAVGAALAVVAALLAGHSEAVGPAWLMWPSDIVHVVAAATWAGGLVLLARMVIDRRRDPDDCAVTAIGFSTLASVAFVLAGITGVLMAVLVLPSASALWTTTWGVLLIAKVAVVAVVAMLGAWNHLVLIPRLRGARDPGDLAHLRTTAVVEVALLTVAVILTAVLVGFSP